MVLLSSSTAAPGQIKVGTDDPRILCIITVENTCSQVFCLFVKMMMRRVKVMMVSFFGFSVRLKLDSG